MKIFPSTLGNEFDVLTQFNYDWKSVAQGVTTMASTTDQAHYVYMKKIEINIKLTIRMKFMKKLMAKSNLI